MKRLLALLCLLPLLALATVACSPDESDTPQTDGTTESEQAEQGSVGDEATRPDGPSGAGSVVFDYDPAARGGTLVVGQSQEPHSLYLYGGSTLAAAHVLNAIYDGPIESIGFEYQPVIVERLPDLEGDAADATKDMVTVEVGSDYVDSADGMVKTAEEQIPGLPQLTARFTIRDGVTWQDGTPVTAADSVFSQSLACDAASPTSKVVCDRTARYEAIDERTVEWQGLPGYENPTYFTVFYTPLPRHQPNTFGERMDELTPVEIASDMTYTQQPFSFGAFKIDEWTPAEQISLSRNDNYWRAEEGLPFLDGVEHRFFADSGSLLAALLAGDVNVATHDGLGIGQAEQLDQAQGNGQVTTNFMPSSGFEHIDFNLLPADDRPAFGACFEIRRAMTLGTDRQEMVDQVMKGLTQVQHSYVSPDHWAYPSGDNAVMHPYDPEQAMALLDELGFTDDDEDGVREAQDDIDCTVTDIEGGSVDQTIAAGTPLEFTLNTTTGSDMRQQAMLVFQENMKDIGVKVVLEFMQPEQYFAETADAPLSGRRYDLGQFGWLPSITPPAGLYMCGQIPTEDNDWSGKNNAGWCDPEYDDVAMKAESAMNRDDAVALFGQAQKRFAEALPVIPLFAPVHVMATMPNVVNFKPDPTVSSETWNIETWGFSEQ